jgi:hypothetical protein
MTNNKKECSASFQKQSQTKPILLAPLFRVSFALMRAAGGFNWQFEKLLLIGKAIWGVL